VGYAGGMSIEQLKSFVAVAEEGAIVRAARRLHLSQPPLTRRIQDLEYELGAPLFERGPRGVSLTAAGEALLPRARVILALVEDARDGIRQVGAGGVD
jgi:LysR family transcriptional regulator, benzoate and cis,cis-muconate-responsive activator of ben and cat genes